MVGRSRLFELYFYVRCLFYYVLFTFYLSFISGQCCPLFQCFLHCHRILKPEAYLEHSQTSMMERFCKDS